MLVYCLEQCRCLTQTCVGRGHHLCILLMPLVPAVCRLSLSLHLLLHHPHRSLWQQTGHLEEMKGCAPWADVLIHSLHTLGKTLRQRDVRSVLLWLCA